MLTPTICRSEDGFWANATDMSGIEYNFVEGSDNVEVLEANDGADVDSNIITGYVAAPILYRFDRVGGSLQFLLTSVRTVANILPP